MIQPPPEKIEIGESAQQKHQDAKLWLLYPDTHEHVLHNVLPIPDRYSLCSEAILPGGVFDFLAVISSKFLLKDSSHQLSQRHATSSHVCRIGGLAGQVMRMVEALVKKSDSQITDSASVLQQIVAASADEGGEWHLPLSDESVAAMRTVQSRVKRDLLNHREKLQCQCQCHHVY